MKRLIAIGMAKSRNHTTGSGKKAGSQTAKQDLAILNDFVRMLEPGSTTSGDATLLELLQKLSKDVREKLHTFLKENLTAAGQGWRSPAFDPLLGSSRQHAAAFRTAEAV